MKYLYMAIIVICLVTLGLCAVGLGLGILPLWAGCTAIGIDLAVGMWAAGELERLEGEKYVL